MDKYKVNVPEGSAGSWRIECFTVSPTAAQFSALREGSRAVSPGTYTALKRDGYVIMSDTPAEIGDHLEAIRKAHGHCLVNGLGLGMVLQAIARKPEVTKVTVIEKSADVIALVAPHYAAMFGDKVEIVNADAYEYQPPKGVRYGAVWHDIWDDLCTDNLPEMERLHRKYGRRCDWQGSWGKWLLQYRRQREQRRGWFN